MTSQDLMALAICRNALEEVIRSPRSPQNEWHDGKVCSAALICDIPEVVSLRNQVVYLHRHYNRRHFGRTL